MHGQNHIKFLRKEVRIPFWLLCHEFNLWSNKKHKTALWILPKCFCIWFAIMGRFLQSILWLCASRRMENSPAQLLEASVWELLARV